MINMGKLREANKHLKNPDVAAALRRFRNGEDAGDLLVELVIVLAKKVPRGSA
jgi:hypothetical protein